MRFRPNPSGFSQLLAGVDQIYAISSRFRQIWPDLGQMRPGFDQICVCPPADLFRCSGAEVGHEADVRGRDLICRIGSGSRNPASPPKVAPEKMNIVQIGASMFARIWEGIELRIGLQPLASVS